MDVLSPQLMWINGSCYRINPTLETQDDNPVDTAAPIPYTEEDLYAEDDEDDYDIKTTSNGRFKTSFHVPNVFRGIVIGTKGITKKRIETETKTTIEIPKSGNDGAIEIFGVTRQNVATARRRIELIVLGGRSKQQITHIVCIPTVNQSIKDKFNELKQQILNDSPAYGVVESLFQIPDRLHLTLCGLSLMDNEDRCLAADILQSCKESVIMPKMEEGPIHFTISGVECMNDDPGAINVLYAKVKCERLQTLVDEIHEYFIGRGLVQRQYDRVKLHVTLMNTRYNQGDTFDARKILEKYSNYQFGAMQLKEIHLSQRFTRSSDGFFEATAILKL